MGFAYPMQKFQDWLTQQWVIFRGRKIDPENHAWLMGPFGNLDNIGADFISKFAQKEGLIIERNGNANGLIPSITDLNLSKNELLKLSQRIIHFYEHTNDYHLDFSVTWKPFFKIFGILLKKLFSNRIKQLNIPTKNIKNTESLTSEIITLINPVSKEPKYTFWFRSIQSTGEVVYSGVYGIATLPSGKTCIKAVFPLPNGNATVFMVPSIGANGGLVLESSGKNFGDAGFYFLLKDAKGQYWSQFISTFRDRLIVSTKNEQLIAKQVLTLWHKTVLTFNYVIKLKK